MRPAGEPGVNRTPIDHLALHHFELGILFHARCLGRQIRMTSDDTQQCVVADRQDNAPREPLSRPSAQCQTKMMNIPSRRVVLRANGRDVVAASRSAKSVAGNPARISGTDEPGPELAQAAPEMANLTGHTDICRGCAPTAYRSLDTLRPGIPIGPQ